MSLLGSAIMGAIGGAGKVAIGVGERQQASNLKQEEMKTENDLLAQREQALERLRHDNAVKLAGVNHDNDVKLAGVTYGYNMEINNATMAHEVKLKIAELQAKQAEGNLDRKQQLELLKLQNAHDAWKTRENNNTTLSVTDKNNATSTTNTNINAGASIAGAQIGADSREKVAQIGADASTSNAALAAQTDIQVAGMNNSAAALRQQAGFDHATNILGIEIASKEKMQQAGFNHESALEDSRQRHARIIQQATINATSEENAKQRTFDAVQNDLQRSSAIKAISEQTQGALALAVTKANLELANAKQMPITAEDLQIGADSSGQFFFYMDPMSGNAVKLTGITAPDANKLNIRDIPTGEAGLLGEREKMPHVLVNGQWVPMQVQGQASPDPLLGANPVESGYSVEALLQQAYGQPGQ